MNMFEFYLVGFKGSIAVEHMLILPRGFRQLEVWPSDHLKTGLDPPTLSDKQRQY